MLRSLLFTPRSLYKKICIILSSEKNDFRLKCRLHSVLEMFHLQLVATFLRMRSFKEEVDPWTHLPRAHQNLSDARLLEVPADLWAMEMCRVILMSVWAATDLKVQIGDDLYNYEWKLIEALLPLRLIWIISSIDWNWY